jgi:DNA-binding NarL/FixJ family response regulator
MSTPRKKRSSRKGPPHTNRYFHALVSPLRLVNLINQENRSSIIGPGNAGGRRSVDRDALDLYDCWLTLSPRERHVTYLTCIGYKNHQIAFDMGVKESTVKTYLQHIYYKVNVRSKTELRLKFVNFDFKHNFS